MTDTKEREEFEWLLQIKGSEYHVDEQGNLGYANPFHHCMWLGYLTGLQRQQQRISELQAQLAVMADERVVHELTRKRNAELLKQIEALDKYIQAGMQTVIAACPECPKIYDKALGQEVKS